MFPKKRKQKEKHTPQRKITKKNTDTEYITPRTPIPGPASPTFSIYSDYGESSVYSPPNSRPSTPKGDPILSDKDTLIFFGDEKGKKKEVSLSNDYINNDTEINLLNQLDMMEDFPECPPTPSIGPSSPTFSVYSESSERCDSPNIYEVPKTPSAFPTSPIASTSREVILSSQVDSLIKELLVDEVSYPIPPSPIDFNNLEKYVNLASPSTIDWQDTETFLSDNHPKPSSSDDLLFKVPYPVAPNMIPIVAKITYESVFDCMKDGSKFTYFIPVNKEPASGYIEQEKSLLIGGEDQLEQSLPSSGDNSLTTVLLEDSDDDNLEEWDYNITSNRLFDIMKHVSDCENNKELLNSDIFEDIDNCNTLIYNFNFSMRDIILKSKLVRNTNSTYRGTLTRSIIAIFNHLKSLYPEIYPAKKILKLIKSNPNNLCCFAMLYHEDGISERVNTTRAYISDMISYPAITQDNKIKRAANLRNRIFVLAEAYKNLYNL
ncbi:MAG: hypothetical protein KFW09_05955 [Oscillospiraceae bacterium]|nr:hypothetical protein [Oscillospiraceae bacterium]